MIPGLRDLEYEQRLFRLRLPTLAYRRLLGDMIETYKILPGKYDTDVTEGLSTLGKTAIQGGTALKFSRRDLD